MSKAEKILVVDDNPETLRLVFLVLKRQNYQVLAAHDGLQGIAMAKKELPQLILLDVMMPGLDGLEVARRLRADSVTAHIPIIVFTAKSGLEDELQGFEAGADDYLTKLASPAELLARVRAVLARASKIQRGRLIGVIAPKGGMGVTTVALNLGVALHKEQKKAVIVTDFRPGQGSLAFLLGIENPQGLNHLLRTDATEITPQHIENEIIRHRSGVRLLLSSYQPTDAILVGELTNLKNILKFLPQLADFVVIDLPSMLLPMNLETLQECDDIIVLTEPIPHSILHTQALINDLTDLGMRMDNFHFVLVNRGGNSIQLSWQRVESELGQELAVIITPAGEAIHQSSIIKQALITTQPDSLAAEQFHKLARLLIHR